MLKLARIRQWSFDTQRGGHKMIRAEPFCAKGTRRTHFAVSAKHADCKRHKLSYAFRFTKSSFSAAI